MSARAKADLEYTLSAVASVVRTITLAEDLLRRNVTVARKAGASWERIGAALGVTRSAAWQRYGKPASTRVPGDLPPRLDGI